MSTSVAPEAQQATCERVWRLYRGMAGTSARLKRAQGYWRQVILVLTALALPAAPFAKTLERVGCENAAKGLVIASTLLFAVVSWVNKDVLGDDAQRPWVRARQTAEQLKSLAFRFLMNLPPYTGPAAADTALKRAEEIVAASGTVPEALGPESAHPGIPEAPLTAASYVTVRLDDQVAFYERAVGREQRLQAYLLWAGRLLSFAVAALGALAALIAQEWRDIWVPALGVASTMVTTQVTLARRAHLIDSYSMAATRLGLAKTAWEISPKGPTDETQLASRVEDILNAENAGWFQQMMLRPADGKQVPEGAAANPVALSNKNDVPTEAAPAASPR